MSEKRDPEICTALDQIVGYLNFSSGASDPQFLSNLNLLFAHQDKKPAEEWYFAYELLSQHLQQIEMGERKSPFNEVTQARQIVELLPSFLVAYHQFHGKLLFHQHPSAIHRPFFIGRVLEALLEQLSQNDSSTSDNDLLQRTISQLNDYVGYRPVPVLEGKRIEPYEHEWIRPIPVYIAGAGCAHGTRQEVIEKALELLQSADEDLLEMAHFIPDHLEELALDPRAYDFDHPVNKRPNHHFGLWDPHQINNQGFYTRFVVQEVTLDALMTRVEENNSIEHDEMVFEAAAVLAGTILMASGVSGRGPDSHDSNMTLASLLPGIARYRDVFYEQLITNTTGAHAARLMEEARDCRQPFGGARQHLNAQLARRRASQLEHVTLAKIYARMGYPEAAQEEAAIVPVASARALCRIDCLITQSEQAADRGDLQTALDCLPQIMELIQDGIQCGSIVDPWNILGFDGNFSLFPALENSVPDHRIDNLIELMEQLFARFSRIWSDAAASDKQQLCQQIQLQFERVVDWWRKYAAHEVTAVEAVDPQDVFQAAAHVAQAMQLWHEGGAATGDIRFWAPYAAMFDSPKAYALVIDALLQRGDFVTSTALLAHWLGQADRIGLVKGDSSFHALAERWALELRFAYRQQKDSELDPWGLSRKFFDYLEANAESFWQVPKFDFNGNGSEKSSQGLHDESDEAHDTFDEDPYAEEDELESLFSAAYEDMTYQDSTDDGVEGSIFEERDQNDELEFEAKRISRRLEFISTISRLWKLTALAVSAEWPANECEHRSDVMQHWIKQIEVHRHELNNLQARVNSYRIPRPGGDHDSLLLYDRRRLVKESLLEQVIQTNVEVADAGRMLLAATKLDPEEILQHTGDWDWSADQRRAISLFSAILSKDTAEVQKRFPGLISALVEQPLLYVPLARGGDPQLIGSARIRQKTIQDLLAWLPRIGLLEESCELIETAREMEVTHPVGPGAVTEFDELFQIGFMAQVKCLARCSEEVASRSKDTSDSEQALVQALEELTESMLVSWLAHSKTLRLSVLEKVRKEPPWEKLVKFIEKYGHDLFTQRFFNLGNLRAILHQGVDAWLDQVSQPENQIELKLLDDLESGELSRLEAVKSVSLVLEAIIENYTEYRDYNSTTTQSDRGELLYMLLDFLRLRISYDRISWNLKPVVVAHQILVKRGHNEAAQIWRRALTDRISQESEKYLERLVKLQKLYAMRMPTVADRLNERFMRPMTIDSIRALVSPAIKEATEETHPTFSLLQKELAVITEAPSGVGLDIPPWLMALDEEVIEARQGQIESYDDACLNAIPPICLDWEVLQNQLERITKFRLPATWSDESDST